MKQRQRVGKLLCAWVIIIIKIHLFPLNILYKMHKLLVYNNDIKFFIIVTFYGIFQLNSLML